MTKQILTKKDRQFILDSVEYFMLVDGHTPDSFVSMLKELSTQITEHKFDSISNNHDRPN